MENDETKIILEQKIRNPEPQRADDKWITSFYVTKDSKDSDPQVHMVKNAVSTEAIKNGAITADKMSKDAIDTTNIINGAITTNKIKNKTITSDKIAFEKVQLDNLASSRTNNYQMKWISSNTENNS